MTRMTKAQQAERAEAIETLRELLPPGSKLYTVLRHVSRSGMSRHIDLYVMQDGDMRWLSGLAARAMGERLSNRDAIVMGGAGMDMGFALVYNLSHTLYPDGFLCIGEAPNGDHWTRGCPSNDHMNDRGERNYSPDRHHESGGYALRQVWL